MTKHEYPSDTEMSIALRRLRAWRDGGSALQLPREDYALNAAVYALESLRWACCDRPLGAPHKVSCLRRESGGTVATSQGRPCPDCRGTGGENGVTSKGECGTCGGTGRIEPLASDNSDDQGDPPASDEGQA